MRRTALFGLCLVLVGVEAFLGPRPGGGSFKVPIRLLAERPNGEGPVEEEHGTLAGKTLASVCARLGRHVAPGLVILGSVLGGVVPGSLAAPAFGGPRFDEQTVRKQLERVDKEEQNELREDVKDPSNIIAKGIVRLPTTEDFPLGPNTPGALNLALENDNAALLLACYGREGGPVAAKKVPLRGLEFPFNFELTADNLLFPQTKATWEKDLRAADDLGISALLDLDGKFATANENDLIGFGISKPVSIAGSLIRRDALIVVQPRTGVKQYSEDELEVLSKIDFEIARQESGASLAQLAQGDGAGQISVLTETDVQEQQPEPPLTAPTI